MGIEMLVIKKNRRGMTLIETLLSLTILVTVGTCLFASISAGVNLWKKASLIEDETDVHIFIERLTADLKTAAFFSMMGFDGSQTRLSFPSVKTGDQLYQLSYEYDYDHKTINMRRRTYDQLVKKTKVPAKTVLRNVREFNLMYYAHLSSNEKLDPKLEIQSGVAPRFVKVEIVLGDDPEDTKKIVETIEVPIAPSIIR